MSSLLIEPVPFCYSSDVQIKVCIVEDDPGIRESLAKMITKAHGFSCLGAFPDGVAALAEIPKLKPDVVLMDINMPRMSGIECVRSLKSVMPAVRIIMFTVYEESEQLFKALSAGANGYLLKRTPPKQLLQAISDAFRGGAPMTQEIACKLVEHFHQLGSISPELEKLSPREHETLALLAEGFRYKEIADKMGISVDTVGEHVSNIYHKLHVTSRTEAVVKFLQKRSFGA